MQQFVQQAVNALSVGGEYALIALGLAIVFSVIGLVNFAHGEIITVSGFVMLGAHYLGMPPWSLLIVGVLAAMATALLLERVAFRPIRNTDPTTGLLTAFGVSILIQNAFIVFVATRPRAVPTPDWLRATWSIGSINVPALQVIESITTVVGVLGLVIFLRRTNIGLAMRAASTDFDTVRLMGIRANGVIASAFAISGLLAGLAALFIVARRGAVDGFMGFAPVLKAFVATVLGGFGNLGGAVIGGLTLGVLEVTFSALLPPSVAGFRDAFVFGLVALLLTLRPQGILGGNEVDYAG